MRAFRVNVRNLDEDDAVASLWEAGTHGIEVQPAGGDRVSLLAYFDDATTASHVTAALRHVLGCGPAEPVDVPAVDWVRRFRAGFRGFRAGSFEVLPVWELPDERPPDDPGLLVVDPGRAFGTGTHETTRLCLSALEARAAAGPLRRVLDVGTGTGLLAVAAAKLGASFVVGTDNDPEASAAAQRHAALNGVSICVVQGDGGRPFRAGSFDVVLANLMAPLLLERQPEIVSLLPRDGTLILSGLLDTDVAEVSAAYRSLGLPVALADGEWAALVFTRRA